MCERDEITQVHFSENWAVEQVANWAPRGLAGWAPVPHLLAAVPMKHRRSAFNALRIAHTLLLIELAPKAYNDSFTPEELGMCPQGADGPLVWARVKPR